MFLGVLKSTKPILNDKTSPKEILRKQPLSQPKECENHQISIKSGIIQRGLHMVLMAQVPLQFMGSGFWSCYATWIGKVFEAKQSPIRFLVRGFQG